MKHKWLKDITPIEEELEHDLRGVGIYTGSYVFGGYKEGESDVDLLVLEKSPLTFNALFHLGHYDPHNYHGQDFEFNNCYFATKDGEVLNVLFFSKKEHWREWVDVTRFMIKLLGKSKKLKKLVSRDKQARVHLFEHLRWQLSRERNQKKRR